MLHTFAVLSQNGGKDLFFQPEKRSSGDVSIVSNYLYRGQTLSENKPAIQGSYFYDFTKSGIALGTFLSLTDAEVPHESNFLAMHDWQIIEEMILQTSLTGLVYFNNPDQNSFEASLELQLKNVAFQYNWDLIYISERVRPFLLTMSMSSSIK